MNILFLSTWFPYPPDNGSKTRVYHLLRALTAAAWRNLLTVAAYTLKPHGGQRLPNRNARLLALRDAALGRWGQMGADSVAVYHPD